MLALHKGQKVLDLACGTGGLTILVADIVGPEGKVIGIDLSQRMLNVAKQKSSSYPQIKYIRKNFENLSYNNDFDAVVIGFGAHEVPASARLNLYRTSFRSLKKGGKLLVFDFADVSNRLLRFFYWVFMRIFEHPYGWVYVNEDHAKVLKEIGFKLIKHKKLGLFDIAVYKKNGQ
jgi:demethylmenaquinone methyltransferase/2-methoxy-6-polyprenyl-1,4-benzoquinol methylase